MPRPQISHGFTLRRKANNLQAFKDGLKIGMDADDVLALAKKKLIREVHRPEKISEDEHGYIVNWFYPGVIITLRRESTPGAYKISKIEEGEILQS